MQHSYESFVWTQFWLPIIGSAAVAGGMGIAGCSLKVDKAVRIMFPHINKHGNKTVMFGFVLKEPYIYALFIIMLLNVLFTTIVFWLHIVIVRSTKYNPYDDFECFYSSNHSRVELSPEEALTLEEDVDCFAWTLNIGGAVGQATGTLLLAWVVVSVVTWIILKASHRMMKMTKDKSHCKVLVGWFLMGLLQAAVYIVPCGLVVAGAVLFRYREISLLSLFDLLFFSFVLFLSSSVLWWHVEKEPKSLEDCCSKQVEEMITKEDKKYNKRLERTKERTRDITEKENNISLSSQYPTLVKRDERNYELDKDVLHNRVRLLKEEENKASSTAERINLLKERIAIHKERLRLKEERVRLDKEKLKIDKDKLNVSTELEYERANLDKRELELEENEMQLARYKLLSEMAHLECQRLLIIEAATHFNKEEMTEIAKVAIAHVELHRLGATPLTGDNILHLQPNTLSTGPYSFSMYDTYTESRV